MEWDSAAAHAIFRETGREILDWECEQPLTYNKVSLNNPHFIAY
jgi:3'(2'), 5'-bisphosphate nucleotidase